MSVDQKNYKEILAELGSKAKLVAVSKTKSAADITELYNLGHRDFGENYVQELVDKYAALPTDIQWHFIGHLQSNKVKFIVPFISLIHGVDSFRLLREINKQGQKNNRTINCLLQVHIAKEETKFGLSEEELSGLIVQVNTNEKELSNVNISGLMGMASFTDDMEKVRSEFRYLKSLFDKHSKLETQNSKLTILSMGMSADYKIAIEEGSNMVRIGSLIFGERNYS
jgi:pyridoxal phosphate enzyme (YggS family)